MIKKIHFETIDSTNLWCKNNLESFDNNNIYCITADEQISGKGTNNRKWISPKGGFYCTLCFKISESNNINTLPLVMGMSMCNILNKKNINANIKWPNDIILNNKKIGGILSEAIKQNNELWVIIGLGLNVNLNKEQINGIDRILFPASSILIENKINLKPYSILDDFLKDFQNNLCNWTKYNFSYFKEIYNKYNILNKKTIYINSNNNEYVGEYVDINNDGILELRTNSQIKKFTYGDIIQIV